MKCHCGKSIVSTILLGKWQQFYRKTQIYSRDRGFGLKSALFPSCSHQHLTLKLLLAVSSLHRLWGLPYNNAVPHKCPQVYSRPCLQEQLFSFSPIATHEIQPLKPRVSNPGYPPSILKGVLNKSSLGLHMLPLSA